MTTLTLPEPGYPMLMLMVSNPLFPPSTNPEHPTYGRPPEPVVWVTTEPHPFVPNARIVRMLVDRDSNCVGIYSVSTENGAAKGMRDLVPLNMVRLMQEAMPFDIFQDVLAEAEAGAEDDAENEDPDPESEPDLEPEPVAPTEQHSSGQATS